MMAVVLSAACASGIKPWPAESHASAMRLTKADSEFDVKNMSGASWNLATRTLWIANNSGQFWALVEGGPLGFRVATNAAGVKAKWSPGGDLESICQADLIKPIVHLLDEDGWIREFDVSQYGVVRETRKWSIRKECPEINGAGPEGLAFVPDQALRKQGFRDGNGALCVSSNGMGGLMFVGYQRDGSIHVFDLDTKTNTCRQVGVYRTTQNETAGLEYEPVNGRLYIWHNTGGNSLEVTGLDLKDGRLRLISLFAGPRDGNLEGFAVAGNWCFVLDDDNDDNEAICWYRNFHPVDEIPSTQGAIP